ncbi:hypothetical protein PsYK624_013980 [Phanerochaete sordida]|uniref:DUF6533 domain-containing protein n=1 Tax=Phanerochaete sordida TaxID=48140 RepID=A0A9P3FZT5_9APHY|nr:hypothetical protein PsYK624_013980 [Phanerochaete sordida]
MPELVITDPVGLLSQRLVDRHLAAAVTALAVFEYVITFNDELCTAWRRRLNATSLLLISTRWVMVIAPTLAWATLSTQRYVESSWWKTGLLTSTRVAVRRYRQLYKYSILLAQHKLHCSRHYACLRYGNEIGHYYFSIWPLASSLQDALPFSWHARPTYTWTHLLTLATKMFRSLVAPGQYVRPKTVDLAIAYTFPVIWLPAIATIAGNTLVLALTWAKTFRAVWMLRHMNPMSLVACMLRDGTIYFLILLALNVTQPITYYLTPSKPMSTFGLVIPAMLMSRFIMNLRRFGEIESSRSGSGYTDSRPVRFTTPMVTAPTGFLGNIGEELDHSQADSRGEDVDEAFLEDRDLGSASFVVGSQMRGTTAAPSTDGTSYDTLKAAVYVNV